MHKVCTKCREEKPLDRFGKHRIQVDGLNCRCKDCCREQNISAYQANADSRRKAARDYYALNRVAARERNRAWIAANRARVSQKQMARRRENPVATIHHRVSASISQWFHRKRGGQKTSELVGYTMQELKQHLERQFVKGMGWHNMSEWHIDHIVPLASFTITGPDDPEIRRAWALTNLRPLWAIDNIRKGARMETLL